MFDKLIESDTAGAEFKNRSRYFTVSTIVVGTLFLTAVVYSLYGAEVGLGAVNFDVSELVAPLEATEPEPKREPEQNNRPQLEPSELPIRTDSIARIDEYQYVPDKPSSEASKIPSRPIGKYILDPGGTNTGGSGGPTGSPYGRPGTEGGTSSATNVPEDEDRTTETPPPPVKVKPAIVRTSRVLNGSALSLPVPLYPKPAQMLNLAGAVKVQVTIDERGNVISAKAIDGHPLFRGVAEQSARGAKFKPTLLNDEPVKVTGLIVYNFKRN